MGQVAHDSLPAADTEKYCYSYLIVIFCNTAHNNAKYIIMHLLFIFYNGYSEENNGEIILFVSLI